MPRPVKLLIGLSMLCQAATAQDSVSDSSYSKTAYDNAVTYYHKYTDKQSRLYNGFLHIGYSHKIEGHAYFPVNQWNKGTVVYDGITFPDVNMLYDIYKDELVIQHFHRLMLTLHNDKLTEFSFDGNRFIRIVRDSTKNVPFGTGIYQELHRGKTSLLVKRVKIMEETITDVLVQKFISKNYYYINRNNTWHAVKTFKELRSVLKEKSKEIRQHLNKNKIRYRRDREKAIVMAVQYFDAITQ